MVNYIYGLGGRELPPEDITKVYNDIQGIAAGEKSQPTVQWLGVRE